MLYIATLDELKQELGLTDAQDDEKIVRLAELLQGRFDSQCNRTLARAVDAVEFFDGGHLWLLTKRFPVEAIASLYLDDDRQFGPETLLDAADYRLSALRGRIAFGPGARNWPGGIGAIKLVYTGGYVAGGQTAAAGQYAMDPAIRRAFFFQFGYEWRNRLTLGQQSVSAQGVSVSLAPAKLLPEVVDTLAPFERR